MNEQFNWYKNQLVQHLHVSKQATKISEIRLHYLGYKHSEATAFALICRFRSTEIEQHLQPSDTSLRYKYIRNVFAVGVRPQTHFWRI